jgi:pyruvate kinase
MMERADSDQRPPEDFVVDEAPLERVDALITELRDVVDRVSSQGEAICRDWDRVIVDPGFRASALNLAHYLALRQLDLSDIQPALSELGLSSLGRSEGHVRASLTAVLATLSRLAGRPGPAYPGRDAWDEPSRLLRERRRDLFGDKDAGPAVMVTLPSEAAQDPKLVRTLVRAGMDCARINCAHDDPPAWKAMVRHVRKAAAAEGRSCRILMDLGGPKCRIEAVAPEKPDRLHVGRRFALVKSLAAAPVGMPAVTVSLPEILAHLSVGAPVWINDGRIRSRIVDKLADGFVLEVTGAREKGEKLRPEKGLNVPGADLGLAPLTEDDLRNLDFVAAHADLVGFSFVQKPSDIDDLDRELERRLDGRRLPPIVLKIETAQAVRNLPRLIVRAAARRPAAVMIARGDLAVDLGFGRMAEIQEEILWLCEAASLPVIWATQVLDDLVRDGLPSRAEATDAAMAQRAECVMLNKGPHLAEAIRFLADVAGRMDRHQSKKSARFGPLHSWPLDALPLAPGRARTSRAG